MPLVQIFAKPPVEGKVKTRLIPDLGAARATRVYQFCLQYTLDMLRAADVDYEVWLGEASTHDIFDGESYQLQQGVDLGERMSHALSKGIARLPGEAILLIGSDCLDITEKHLNQAITSLRTKELVLLPSIDGGFAMIACKRFEASLFDDVQWSSNVVLSQTLSNAEKLGFSVDLLETVRDIDTLNDLNYYPELSAIVANH